MLSDRGWQAYTCSDVVNKITATAWRCRRSDSVWRTWIRESKQPQQNWRSRGHFQVQPTNASSWEYNNGLHPYPSGNRQNIAFQKFLLLFSFEASVLLSRSREIRRKCPRINIWKDTISFSRKSDLGMCQQIQHSNHAESTIKNPQNHNKFSLVCDKPYPPYRP